MRPLSPSLLVLLAVLLAPTASGQVVLAEEEAVARALERHPVLRAAHDDAAAARAAYGEARAGALPTLNARGTYTRLGNVPDAEILLPEVGVPLALFAIPRNQVYSELGLEQPLFAGGRLRQRVRAAARRADAAYRIAEQEAADVAFAVRAAYAGLLQARALLDAADAALAAVDAHAPRVEALLAEGAALRIDLLNAQARRSEVRLDRVEAEHALRLARLELNRLVGLPLAAEVAPAAEPPPRPLAELDALTDAAVAARPALLALGEGVRALEAEVAATRGAWLPEVAAFGRLVYARPNPLNILEQDAFHGHWEAGLAVRWSLFDAGRPAATAGARARLRAAEARLAEAREAVGVEVARRYLEAVRAEEALAVADEHVAAAEAAFAVVQRQFEEGAALPGHVLEAEQVLRAAQARRARAAGGRAVARAALLQVAGQVW